MNVEHIHTAQANNTAVSESASTESILESGGETKIPNQAKDKAHCFCPKFARDHGERAAVIVQGLGHKVARSKKNKDGRKWHYDTLDTLEKKWPYMRDSGIWGIIEHQVMAGNIFKGRYNNWPGDRTGWYSVQDDLVRRAMEDEGKIWFDVNAAVKCHSIVAGTLYQNVRYHLLLQIADHPDLDDTPYHRVNKAALARILPWSLSTIQRGFDKLVEHHLCDQHPDRTTDYTIRNLDDLVVPEGMRKHAEKKAATESRTEKTSGSSTKMTGSTTEQSRSFAEENVSSAENNTHYKPFTKTIHKHHSPTAARQVGGVCSDVAGAAERSRHERFSSTVPDKDHCSSGRSASAHPDNLSALITISKRVQDLEKLIPPDLLKPIKDHAIGCAFGFVSECSLTPSTRFCKDAEDCLNAIAPVLARNFRFPSNLEGGSEHAEEFWKLTTERVVLAAILLSHHDAADLKPAVADCTDAVWACHCELPVLSSLTDLPAPQKASLLKAEIQRFNLSGWLECGEDTPGFKVSTSGSFSRQAEHFFGERPELSVEDVTVRLSDCINLFETLAKPKPGAFDPAFHARRGVRPAFLFKYWDEIELEVAA